MNRRARITIIERQKRVFWSLCMALLVLFAAYGYFVSKSVANVLLREEVEEEMLTVNSEISKLEFAYLEKKNQVSLEYAYELGFRDIHKKEFVARKSLLSSQLTLNNEI